MRMNISFIKGKRNHHPDYNETVHGKNEIDSIDLILSKIYMIILHSIQLKL